VALKMKKSYEDQDQSWHVDIMGEVDIHTSGNLKDALNNLLNEKETSIKINCDKLIYIDSTGLGVLIGVLKRVKKNENDIFIQGAQSNISKLLNITGLDKIFIMSE